MSEETTKKVVELINSFKGTQKEKLNFLMEGIAFYCYTSGRRDMELN